MRQSIGLSRSEHSTLNGSGSPRSPSRVLHIICQLRILLAGIAGGGIGDLMHGKQELYH